MTDRERPENQAGGTDGSGPALASAPPGLDPDWRQRIRIAKEVRAETRKARGDKPSTFDMRGHPIRFGR